MKTFSSLSEGDNRKQNFRAANLERQASASRSQPVQDIILMPPNPKAYGTIPNHTSQ